MLRLRSIYWPIYHTRLLPEMQLKVVGVAVDDASYAGQQLIFFSPLALCGPLVYLKIGGCTEENGLIDG